MIPAITEINFPAYATLHQATVSLQEMGERTISTQVRIDGDIAPSFDDWELRFKGERFILPHKDPQAAKDNTTRNSLVDLTFTSWANQELKRYFFFEPTSVNAGTVIADKYQASVNLNIEDFVPMLNQVLDYYFDGKIVASLYMSGQGIYSLERSSMEIDHTYLWDVIVKMFEVYGVRWKIVYNSTTDVYTIQFGYPADRIDDHDFEYGYQGGLLRFERQVQDADLKNILLGRGGEKNLPYRYFKRTDETNESTSIWAADPDAIPELANIYFDRLRDINFRWYVRGWMQNPRRDTSWEQQGYVYPTYSIQSDSPYYFAYQKGLTDEKFNPVEYVKDDASIAEYGERWGALEDNDEIFPTIQGRSIAGIGRIDETVDVSEIVTDDIDAAARSAAIERSIAPMTISLQDEPRTQFELRSEEFTVPAGSVGEITYIPLSKATENGEYVYYDTDNTRLVAVSVDSGTEYPFGSIPQGRYYLKLYLTIFRDTFVASSATGTFGIEGIVLTTSAMDTDAWKPTFDIWVKNIWQTTQGQNENDAQYAERVWLPILGDRAGNEAKVVFSSGMMSISQDYEFTIASYPVPDRSKVINGVPSEWKITLRKSDAEFDATGLFIPNASTGGKPVAGDYFFFIGIDMPNLYVRLAEEELNAAKAAQLETETTISPTWIINLDKVRVHTLEDGEYGQTLADRLAAGATVWITDPRFTPGQRLQLYVQSITYTWNEPSDGNPYLVPDIEVVLSDKVIATEGTVTRIQNEVEAIKTQYAKTSDIEAAVRRVAEPIFLKKTGESDSSDSPTTFSSKITSKGFRQGGIGGTGWGIYRDNIDQLAEAPAPAPATRALRAVRLTAADEPETNLEGDTVIEVDKVIVRKEMHVNSLVINQIAYVGGKEIISAAKMEASQVVENANSYTVYFDQKQNSVANLFQVGDIAYGQRWSADESTTSYYKMVVSAVDVNSITLDKSPKDGSGIPAKGDVIVQYGSTTNSARRYVIVRDVIGGGYERMLSGLNSVTADGNEYYFAGRESGSGPRWFVGDSLGDYAEYEDGVLTIKANVIFKAGQEIPGLSDLSGEVSSLAGDVSDMSDELSAFNTALGGLTTDVNALAYLATALPESDTIVNGGLILSKVIALRDSNNAIKSGINGDPSLSSIAAWYGGPMADKEATPTPASYAQSLFRFDGSGYLAGGNIGWENDGDGHIPGISWETTGGVTSVTIGANVKLEQTGGTDSSVTDLVTAVQSFPSTYLSKEDAATLYHPLGGSTTLVSFKIGGATLTWHPQVGSTPGYIELDSAFVTNGDQIVIDGDPQGGGGGGGATMLRQLEDVYHNATSVLRKNGGSVANGDLLSFDSAGNRWVALDQSTITPDLSNYYTKPQTDTQISTAITALNLGAAATYGVGSVASGNTGLVTGGSVYSAINEAVSSVLKVQGTTSTAISDGSTTNPVVIDGSSYTAKKGDVVMYGNKEFWWTGSAWEELGDEASWALKTTTISAGTGLTGGGTLAANRTISLSQATIDSLALADSAYQKPSTGIPQTDLASALSTKVDNGSTAYGYFSNGILPYNHGGTGISSYTKGNIIYASANNTLAKLAPNTGTKQFLTMTSSVPSWGDVDETDVFGSSAIGSSSLPVYYTGSALATITSLDLLSKNTGYIKGNRFYLTSSVYFEYDSTHGYVTLNAPFVTEGDQIVISGTPGGGGGGGGGATSLYQLEDVYHSGTNVLRADGTARQAGDALVFNSTRGWVAAPVGGGTITSVSLATGATNGTLHLVVNGTAQSDVAVTGLGSMAYASTGDYLPLSAGSGKALTGPLYILPGDGIRSAKPTATYSILWQDTTNYNTSVGALDTATIIRSGASNLTHNRAGTSYTIWDAYNDGSGSGLDADLLDGQHGSYYAAASSLADYVKLSASAAQTIESTNTTDTPLYVKAAAAGGCYIGFKKSDNTSWGFIGISNNGLSFATGGQTYKIWNENNDGSGSGLDADLLDGQHGSYYAPLSALDNYLPLTAGTSKPLTDSLYIITGDTDKAIQFSYDTTHKAGAAWRILSSGTGSSDANYLSFQTGGSSSSATTWNNVLRLSMDNRYVGINLDTPAYQLDVAGVTQIAGNPSSGVLLRIKNTSTNNAWMGFFGASSGFSYLGAGSQHALILQNASGTNVFTVLQSGAASFSSTLSVAGLSTLTGGATIPSTASLKIGNATITWNSNGYLHIDKPLVTAGDQIVISGTPGGGGGGGATSLWGLDDVNIPHDSTYPGNGDLLSYDLSTHKWVNVAASTVGRIYSAGTGISISNTNVISLDGSEYYSATTSRTANTVLAAPNGSNGAATFRALVAADIPTITKSKISDFPTNVSAFTNDAGYISSYVNTWRNVYTGGTSRVGTGTDTKAINFAAGTGISISYKAAGTGSGQSGSANYFSVEIGVAANTYQPLDSDLTAIAAISSGTGLLKRSVSGSTVSWSIDTNTYLTGNQTITLSGDVTGSGTTSISTTIGNGKVTNAMLAGSIANSKLSNSSITINGSSTSLGGSFSTASITAGTAGTSSDTSGLSISVPYVTMNKYGIVTAYDTHTHSISKSDLTTSLESSNGYYVKKSGDTMTGALTPASAQSGVAWTCSTLTASGNISTSGSVSVGTGGANSYLGSDAASNIFLHNSSGYVLVCDGTAVRRGSSLSTATLGSSTYPWGGVYSTTGTFSGNIAANGGVTLANSQTLGGLDTGGTRRTLLSLDSGNGVYLAWGAAAAGYATYINGGSLTFNYGTSHTTSTTISSAGTIRFSIPAFTDFQILRTNSSGSAAITYYAGNQTTNYWVAGADPSTYSDTTLNYRFFWYYGSYVAYITRTGTFTTTGDQVVSSDATLKENLTPVTYSIKDIAKARAVEFDWKDGRGHSMGSIAQDWLKIAPSLVHGEEGNMSLAYGQLALVNTILLARQSESHEERIKELEARVAELESENQRLRMN